MQIYFVPIPIHQQIHFVIFFFFQKDSKMCVHDFLKNSEYRRGGGGRSSPTNAYCREKIKVSVFENGHLIFYKKSFFYPDKQALWFFEEKKTFFFFFEKKCFFLGNFFRKNFKNILTNFLWVGKFWKFWKKFFEKKFPKKTFFSKKTKCLFIGVKKFFLQKKTFFIKN